MKLRSLVFLGAIALLVTFVGLKFVGRRPRDIETEQARALEISLTKPLNSQSDFSKWKQAGPGGIPVLSAALAPPNSLDRAYAWAWSNLPPSAQSNLASPLDADQVRLRASAVLAQRGIGEFVPPSTIASMLKDPDWGVRMNALAILNNRVLSKSQPDALGSSKEEIFSLVMAGAQDSRMEVRMSAVWCLGFFKQKAAEVIPVLGKALNDKYPDVRIRAAEAFFRIDQVRAEKAGVVSAAYDCLNSETGPHGSKGLAADLLRKMGRTP